MIRGCDASLHQRLYIADVGELSLGQETNVL